MMGKVREQNPSTATNPRSHDSSEAGSIADSSAHGIRQNRRADVVDASPGTASLQLRAAQLAGLEEEEPLQGKFENLSIQLKKDAALWSDNNKTGGMTPLKLVLRKDTGAVEKYKFQYNGNKIDSFATNQAKSSDGQGSSYASKDLSTYPVGQGYIKKDNVDLNDKLTKSEIEGGNRDTHFKKANEISGVQDDDKTTWHHMGAVGKLQLVDMNVHGDFWHYGGIAHWGETVAKDDGADGEP